MKILLALALAAISGAAASVHAAEHSRDPNTGAQTWLQRSQGVSLTLTQILPDQLRAFYLGRGFSQEDAERVARACVFQTQFRNEGVAAGIDFDLADWRIIVAEGERPLKLKRHWQKEWAKTGASASARLAFQWALYPTVQHYEIGDWNMGMTTHALPPGTRFDLRYVWRANGKRHHATLRGLRCFDERHTRQ
jgi:hypothetical protein